MSPSIALLTELPSGLPLVLTIGIIALGIVLFLRETLAVDVTALLIMTLFIVTGVLAPEEGFAGFTNYATVTVACMFVLSFAVFRTGLLDPLIRVLLRLGRWNFAAAAVALITIAWACSAFFNDTAVVALLMPAALRLSERSGVSPGRLLMPLSFAALLGGTCTLFGTSTNILVSSIAERHGAEPFRVFEFASAAVWITLGGLAYVLLVAPLLLQNRAPKPNGPPRAATPYVAWVEPAGGSRELGRPLGDCALLREFGAEVASLRRSDGSRLRAPGPDVLLHEGDELAVVLPLERLRELRRGAGYRIVTEDRELAEEAGTQLFEVVVPRGSWLSGMRTSSRVFRHELGQALVGVRRDPRFLEGGAGETRLAEGDLLVICASPGTMYRLAEEDALTVVDEHQDPPFDVPKAVIALLVLVGVIAVAASGLTSIVVSALVGVLALLITRVITPDEAYAAVEWKVIFLLAGVLSMGAALEKTGGDARLANALLELLGGADPRTALAVIFGATFLATNVMSNNATAALMTPIALQLAEGLQVSERPFLLAVMFGASFAFLTPMGYQTNTMIYVPGGYRFVDYVRVGAPLSVIVWILALIVIPRYFPFVPAG